MPHLHQRILNKIKIQSNSAYDHDATRSPLALCIVFKMFADIYVINVRMQWKSICSIQMYCVLCSWCAQRCKNQSNQKNQESMQSMYVRMQKNQESIELMHCVLCKGFAQMLESLRRQYVDSTRRTSASAQLTMNNLEISCKRF